MTLAGVKKGNIFSGRAHPEPQGLLGVCPRLSILRLGGLAGDALGSGGPPKFLLCRGTFPSAPLRRGLDIAQGWVRR